MQGFLIFALGFFLSSIAVVYISTFFIYTKLPSTLDQKHCKCRKIKHQYIKPRVVNGAEVTDPDDLPWVAIFYRYFQAAGKNVGICTGSVITPSYVLTAAHCFYDEIRDLDNAIKQYYVGLNQNSKGDMKNLRNISKVIIHKFYTNGSLLESLFRHRSDLALAIVDVPYQFDNQMHPACLSLSNYYRIKDRKLISAGYGLTKETKKSANGSPTRASPNVSGNALEEKKLLLIPDNKFVGGLLDLIIVRSETSSLCFGDSGGPLILSPKGSRIYVIGVLSMSTGKQSPDPNVQIFCYLGSHAMYNKLDMGWIKRNVNDSKDICMSEALILDQDKLKNYIFVISLLLIVLGLAMIYHKHSNDQQMQQFSIKPKAPLLAWT